MYNLLQGSEKRQLLLAETLIYAGDWMTIKELTQVLNCSERILKYDLKNFKNIFSDFTIETSRYGVRLFFDDNKGLKNIYINLFDSSNAFNILEKIFFNETYSVQELADILYISPSTLYRSIHQINAILKNSGYKIDSNPCRLIGTEENIRYFYYRFFFEKYTILTWPYDQINHDMLNDLLYFFMDLTNFSADFAYYNIAKVMLFVNLTRYKKEHYVSTEVAKMNLGDILSKLEVSPENAEYFEIRYKLKINDQFIIQMFSPFVNEGFTFNEDLFEKQINENKKIANEVKFLRKLLDELSEGNHIPLPNREKVVFELHNSTVLEKYDPRAGYILYNRNKFFVDAVKGDFPQFFKQLHEGITNYRTTLGFPRSENKINYLVYILFTEWENLILELHQQSDKVKVLIVSNRNRAHSYMLKNYLESAFNTQLIAEIYDDTLITTSILEKLTHDFIIANFPIPELRNKESIYIENLPNQNELFQIQNKIKSILSTNE